MYRNFVFVLVFLTVLLNEINAQQMKLVAGHVLFRHGDRTPISTYTTDPIQEKDWPNGFGQLTAAGIEQAHRLGKYLRTRYGSILDPIYRPHEIHVRSTDVDRTLMTAQSCLIGLYPLLNPPNGTVPVQPIPIHTVPVDEDFLLGVNVCPKSNQLHYKVLQSDEYKRKNKYYQPFFKKLQQWTNISRISLYHSGGIFSSVMIEHIYNKTPSWANESVRKNISDIRDFQTYYSYSNYNISRIRGGPLIKDVWKNMNNVQYGDSYWKVKMYSAHDTTISPVLFFLGIEYKHVPQYTSAVFVDLYKQNSTYFVKVEFLNVTDSNVAYPHLLPGCPAFECPLDTFTSIYYPRFPQSAKIECAE